MQTFELKIVLTVSEEVKNFNPLNQDSKKMIEENLNCIIPDSYVNDIIAVVKKVKKIN